MTGKELTLLLKWLRFGEPGGSFPSAGLLVAGVLLGSSAWMIGVNRLAAAIILTFSLTALVIK